MAAEWPTVRLGDHVDSCLGKMLDKEKNRGEFYPYLGNKNVRWGSFDTDDLAQMRFEKQEHDRYGLKFGDLVVCEGGEPGRCAIWKEQIPGMKIQKALHRIRVRETLDNRFLHYWFLLSSRTGFLDPYFTGTTIKHLTGKAIAELPIPLPPLQEQRAIAHILGSLDDKIELNRRMNATLEAMAQALFQSWFVDFDPVIDKALAAGNPIPEPLQHRAQTRRELGERRKPLPADVARHFPDRFVFTEELGWVPEGWEVIVLGKAVNELRRGISPKYTDTGGTQVINQKCIRNHEIDFGLTRRHDHTKKKVVGRELTPGDVLVNSTGVGTLGRMAQVRALAERTVADSHVTVVRPNATVYLPHVFGQAMLSLETQVEALGEGSTGQTELSRANLEALHVLKPSIECQKFLEPDLSVVAKRQDSLSRQSETLGCLRDTLLPKLLSGELRVPDAERLVAEAL
jgi:type I restriction enzyme S subunit